MSTDQETFEAMTATVQKFFPKYKVTAKKDSWLHRTIGWILKPFNPRYMVDFWTYFGNNLVYPEESYPGAHFRSWDVQIHEGTHAGQEKEYTTPLWGSLYLLGTPVPGIVGTLVALPLLITGLLVPAFLSWWISLIVLGLGILLSSPVPFAFWRSEWELQGYGTSVAIAYWCYGEKVVTDKRIEEMVSIFATGSYFWMNVFKSRVRKRLFKARQMARDGTFITKWEPRYSKFYAACYLTLKDQGRLVSKNAYSE